MHVEAGPRRCHIRHIIMAGWVHLLRVDGGDVSTALRSIGKSGYVRRKSAMRKTGIAVRRLRGVAKPVVWVRGRTSWNTSAREVLHPEKMMRDKIVPRGL